MSFLLILQVYYRHGGQASLLLFTVSPSLNLFINPIFQTSIFIIQTEITIYLYLLKSVSSSPIITFASPADPFSLIHTLQLLVLAACISLGFLRIPACLAISLIF